MISMLFIIELIVIFVLFVLFLSFRKKLSNKLSWIFIIVFIILLVLNGFGLIVNNFQNYDISVNEYNTDEYLSGVYQYYVDDYVDADVSGIINNYQEFVSFKGEHSLLKYTDDEVDENDFTTHSYIYYVLGVDECGEKVTGVNKVDIVDGAANIVFNIVNLCGICNNIYVVYFVPIDKDKVNDINSISSSYNIVGNDSKCLMEVKKPILYLYPTTDTLVNVKLDKSNLIRTSYPKYDDGWIVNALSDGSLYDKDGKYYYALYWDEVNTNDVDFSEGFYVTKDKAIEFLEDKLSMIGLNDREKNEFIMYWLPILEDNGMSLVYFELTEERESNNKLIIEPEPDSLLRINMHIKKVNKKINIKEQKLSSFDRKGFVAVEWGGTIHE